MISKKSIFRVIIGALFFVSYAGADSVNQQSNFSFKRVEQADLPLLFAWFNEPHVKEWWPVPEQYENFFEQFLKRIRCKDTFPFLVLMNGKPLGYIQYYYIDRTLEKAG